MDVITKSEKLLYFVINGVVVETMDLELLIGFCRTWHSANAKMLDSFD
jgi:hypothetical protein